MPKLGKPEFQPARKLQLGRSLYERLKTVAECQEAYSKATPKEKEQIKGFVEAVTHGVFGLTHIHNLDTGKLMLTAWVVLPGKDIGLNVNQMRRVVGLGGIKGGDYAIPEPVDSY